MLMTKVKVLVLKGFRRLVKHVNGLLQSLIRLKQAFHNLVDFVNGLSNVNEEDVVSFTIPYVGQGSPAIVSTLVFG